MRIIYSKRKKSTNHFPEDTYISSQNFIYIPTYILTVFEIVNHTERLLERKYVRGQRKEKMSVATELKNISNRLFFFPQRPSNFRSVLDSFRYLEFLSNLISISTYMYICNAKYIARDLFSRSMCTFLFRLRQIFCPPWKFFMAMPIDIFSFYRGQYKRQYQ